MKAQCILCLRSDVSTHIFSKKNICESCICVAYEMVNNTKIKPKNNVEEIIFSFIFLMENEIKFAQDTLNNTQDLQKCQTILEDKLKLLDNMNFSINGINPVLLQSLTNLQQRYKKMLEMFLVSES